MAFAPKELTSDAFLGGKVTALQPKQGYRAATDPVLLAAAVEAKSGENVLELGCGAGVASLCLSARVEGLAITGVERQEPYADLARRNGIPAVTADISDLPADLRQQSFDHVIANPPYYPPGGGSAARDAGRETALREETPLSVWLDSASRRLKPRGWLTMIHAADRLPDLLAAMDRRLGSISLRPVAAREGRPAGRILLRARKEGRARFRLLSPLILHQGKEHPGDQEHFTELASAILRRGAALNWD